ncbi:MAG TPA: FUSC family protein, partial [Bryobacteraceae bacterium]|nr:FUSC family protein [Bryobacteraceae bacterium]
ETVLADWLFSSPVTAPVELPQSSSRMFIADAFSNRAYQVFALKGCLAATICYVIWAGFAWPGLGVCTVTCVIAAPLSIPGSSRQRFTTRILGLLTGGVICGIGSQIFILPAADSIVGFALPFAIVSAAAAWVVTSSPRLSYFGRQMALAYYLTMFQTWGISASLATSRDRLMGILLGLLVMSVVFDAHPQPDPIKS